jgi:hypothetical protein
VAIDERAHPLGDFGNRDIPLDRVKPAVGAPPQRRGQPVLVVRIVRYARSLVA